MITKYVWGCKKCGTITYKKIKHPHFRKHPDSQNLCYNEQEKFQLIPLNTSNEAKK